MDLNGVENEKVATADTLEHPRHLEVSLNPRGSCAEALLVKAQRKEDQIPREISATQEHLKKKKYLIRSTVKLRPL